MYSSLFLVFPQVKIIFALEEESSTPIFFSRFAFLVAAAAVACLESQVNRL